MTKRRKFDFKTVAQLRRAMRCGFELETQLTEGMRYCDTGPQASWGFDANGQYTCKVVRQLRPAWLRNLPKKIEAGRDGSVRGFEFRTRGPCTYAQFKDLATYMFNLKHKIDTRCSFHIHISVPGVPLVIGDDDFNPYIKRMVAYLVYRRNLVPRSVRTRWRSKSLGRHFSAAYGETRFVEFNHGHNTVEFRCFGNVRNLQDAMTCLEFALKAVLYAYRPSLVPEFEFNRLLKAKDDRVFVSRKRKRKRKVA